MRFLCFYFSISNNSTLYRVQYVQFDTRNMSKCCMIAQSSNWFCVKYTILKPPVECSLLAHTHTLTHTGRLYLASSVCFIFFLVFFVHNVRKFVYGIKVNVEYYIDVVFFSVEMLFIKICLVKCCAPHKYGSTLSYL